jgi:hypothetical protein
MVLAERADATTWDGLSRLAFAEIIQRLMNRAAHQ